MPAIDPRFLKCVAYLYPSLEAGRKGEKSGGTAFFVGFPVPDYPNGYVPYVVTNRHLVESGCLFLRIALRDGSTFVDEVPSELWTTADDDDLAVACLALPANHDVLPLGTDLLIGEDCTFEGWPIFPGDDVLFYGRLIGHDGREKNKPVMRFGNISLLPDDDAPIDFGGHKQIAFLVECRSIGGFSGSPAFVHLAEPRTLHPSTGAQPGGSWIPGGTRFLGVNCGHLPFYGVGRARPSTDAPRIPDLLSSRAAEWLS